jgi:DNA-directed RNA polymerase subunit RPC12/RpoP
MGTIDLLFQSGESKRKCRTDVSVAHGCIVLHEVEFYVCPRCGAQILLPERREFVVWTEAAVETTARETVVS